MDEVNLNAQLPELNFSEVEGFTPQTFDYLCPTTGLPCKEKAKLISMYTRDIDEVALQERSVLSDVNILVAKLTEYNLIGRFVNCDPSLSCSVRAFMNESEVRKTAVGMLRLTRKAFQKLVNSVAE